MIFRGITNHIYPFNQCWNGHLIFTEILTHNVHMKFQYSLLRKYICFHWNVKQKNVTCACSHEIATFGFDM